jgi:hypothetical protein
VSTHIDFSPHPICGACRGELGQAAGCLAEAGGGRVYNS